jgi:hypothetical protein
MSQTRPINGSLSDRSACEVLADLCREGETGVLRLTEGSSEKAVYFRKGKIVFASSKDPEDRLGALLLARGVITRTQHEEAAAKIRTGVRLGTVLVQMGFLPAAELPKWVREQVKEILFSVFSWTDGTYRFEAGPLPSDEMITLRLSNEEVFLNGIQRVEKWSVLRKGTGEIRIPYRLVPNHRDLLKEIPSGAPEQGILRLLEAGPLSMEEAAAKSSLNTLRAYQIFFALRILGVVVPEPGAAPAEPEAPGPGVSDAPPAIEAEAEPGPAPEQGATIRLTGFVVPPKDSPPGEFAPSEDAPAIPLAVEPETPPEEAGARTVVLKTPPAPQPPASHPPARQPTDAKPARRPAPPEMANAGGKEVSLDPSPDPPGGATAEEPKVETAAKKRPEYRVIRVESDKLDGNGVRSIEEVLATWGRKGYRLAAVVPGKPSGLFGSSPPVFFIFTRD